MSIDKFKRIHGVLAFLWFVGLLSIASWAPRVLPGIPLIVVGVCWFAIVPGMLFGVLERVVEPSCSACGGKVIRKEGSIIGKGCDPKKRSRGSSLRLFLR